MQNIYNILFFRFLGDNIGDECDFTAVKGEGLKSHVEAVHRDGVQHRLYLY